MILRWASLCCVRSDEIPERLPFPVSMTLLGVKVVRA